MANLRDLYDPKSAANVYGKLRQFTKLVESGKPVPDELLRFVSAGVNRFLDNGVPWVVKQGAKPTDELILMAVLNIDERYPQQRHQIAEYLKVSERQVGNYIREAKALLEIDPTMTDILRSIFDRDDSPLPEMLKSLAYAKAFLSGQSMPPGEVWNPEIEGDPDD